ncbi:hypothetical protein V1525DRAFT_175772 [Lipomyces kononenkoae]|uniref:Uncharacterized protein n=1 Tax=Lipomyces kononenkoae TaxID=34357 RepID=A0ACC3T9J8_LIPKO
MPVHRPPTPYEPVICLDEVVDDDDDDADAAAAEIFMDGDGPTDFSGIAPESLFFTNVGPDAKVSNGVNGGSPISLSRHLSNSSSQTALSSRSSCSLTDTPPTSPSTIGSLTPTIRARLNENSDKADATATATELARETRQSQNRNKPTKSSSPPPPPPSQVVSLTESRQGKIRELVEEHGYAKINKSPVLTRKLLGRATLDELPDDKHYSVRVLIFQDEGFKSSSMHCNCGDMFVDVMLDSARSSKLLEADEPIPGKKGFRPPYSMAYMNKVSDSRCDDSEKEVLWSYKFPRTTIHAVGVKTSAPPRNAPPAFFDDITPRVLLWTPDIILVRVGEYDRGWERQLNCTRLMNKKIVIVIDTICADVAEGLRLKVITRVTTWNTGHSHDLTGPRDMSPGGVIKRYNATRGKSKLVSSTKWLLSPAYINFFFVNSEDKHSFVILHEYLAVFCRARGVFSFTIQDKKRKRLWYYHRDGYDGMAKVHFNRQVVELGSDDELKVSDFEERDSAAVPDNGMQHGFSLVGPTSRTQDIDVVEAPEGAFGFVLNHYHHHQLPLAYIISARIIPEDGFYLDVICHCGYFNKKDRYTLGPIPGTNTFYPIVLRKIISKCTRQRVNLLRAGESAVIRIAIPEYNDDSFVPQKLITLLNRDPRAFRRMAFSVGYNPHLTVAGMLQSAARFLTGANNDDKVLQLAPVLSAVIILDSKYGQFKTNGQDILKPGEFLMIQAGAKAKLVRMLCRIRGYRAICVRLTTDTEEKDYLWSKLPTNLNPADHHRISYHCDEEGNYFYQGERLTISEIVDNASFEFDAVCYSGTVDSVTYYCSA